MRKNYLNILLIIVAMWLLVLPSCKSHKSISIGNEDIYSVNVSKTNSKIRQELKREALSWIGTPYLYGGNTKGKGVDCSGMVAKIYEDKADIKLPRTSSEQGAFCVNIPFEEVLIGDLVFFATGKDSSRISHVGMMIDDGKFIHASGSKGVTISELSNPYYKRTFIKFGRVPNFSD